MSQEPIDDQNQPEEILEDHAPHDSTEDRNRKGLLLGWGASAAVHISAIALMAGVYFAAKEMEKETPPVRVATIEAPPPKEDKKKEQRTLTEQVSLDVEAPESDNPSPVTALDVPVENAERETDNPSETPKGREEAVADAEMGGSGAFMAIGAGGGGSGMFGSRTGGGKKRAIGRGGGSKGSESAVDAALKWFKRHQSPDGSWVASSYWKNCTEGQKCEPGKDHEAGDCTVAMTGYAVLCYLGAGYDHKTPSKFKDTVKKGVDYLVQAQKPDGSIGKDARNYEHPIATMALAEAYAMTQDGDLKDKTQKAVNLILARQNVETTVGADKAKVAGGGSGRLGWDYLRPSTRNDASVTGWNVMALKSALAGGLNVGAGMEGSKNYLEKAWRATNNKAQKINGVEYKHWKDITAYDRSRFPYCWITGESEAQGDNNALAPVGLVIGVFVGRTAGDPLIESLANYVMAHQVPKSYPCNTYFMYYNTLAIFQVGGDKWTKWNAAVRDMLVKAQRVTNDCFDGSWDYGPHFHGADVGRVLHTAYNTLCLEVYYRYAQVHADKKK
jgi:hypothetical protein